MNASSPGQTVAFHERAVAVLGGEPDLATSQKRMMNELFRVARTSLYVARDTPTP